MKHATAVDRELPLFDVNSLGQHRSAEATQVLEEVRRNALVKHEGIEPNRDSSTESAWRMKVPKWIREMEHHEAEPVQVSQDILEQIKLWAIEMVEFRNQHAYPEDLVVDTMSDEEKYLGNVDLTKQVALAQVRLKLSTGLYDSPLLYTVKGLDPWVDKQCTKLRKKISQMGKVYDPNKVMNTIQGFLWPFRQNGFKF